MKIFPLTLGELDTNCFIIATEHNKAVVIDPAAEADKILAVLDENKLSAEWILLTHGHFDHTAAAFSLIEKTGAKLYIHKADEELLSDPVKSVANFIRNEAFHELKPDFYLEDGEEFDLDGVKFRIMHTPGHTRGSVMLFCGDIIFAGDTIFAGSVGRTDLYGGSYFDQRKSLDKIKEIGGNYQIFCGHGDVTTLLAEKNSNPYLRSGNFV